jgi:hypothetical protein
LTKIWVRVYTNNIATGIIQRKGLANSLKGHPSCKLLIKLKVMQTYNQFKRQYSKQVEERNFNETMVVLSISIFLLIGITTLLFN